MFPSNATTISTLNDHYFAISRNLIELHGGTLTAYSAGLGFGTSFLIDLPVSVLSLPPALKISEVIQEFDYPTFKLNNRDFSVLVVDDETDAREIPVKILEDAGTKVYQASNAINAIKILEENFINLLISDLGMPDIDGFQLIEKVRASPIKKVNQVPAIAISALARPEDITRAYKLGYSQHIIKPYNISYLLQVIESLLLDQKKGLIDE